MLPSHPTILGHDQVMEGFRHSLAHGRLASTFLFVGPPGIGKRSTALHLARCLLCEATPSHALEACNTCPSCQQVAALTHPDLIVVAKPPDKSFIPVELLIGDREHRMREGLCHDIALKPFRGGRKMAIIDDADYLNQEGANCLLKTLEEPPPQSVIILIGTSEQRQLPTIRSRCQIIRFSPLSNTDVQQLLPEVLAQRESVADEWTQPEIEAIARRSEGSLSRAVELADKSLDEAVQTLVEQLAQHDFDSVATAHAVNSVIEAAGKETTVRRAQLKRVVRGAIDFYRAVMRQAVGISAGDICASDQLRAAVQKAAHYNAIAAANAIDRCHDALAEIDANANVATLVYSWVDDLAEISRRPQPDA